MARFLVTYTNTFNDLMTEIVDSEELNAGPDPRPETLIECLDDRLAASYRNHSFPPEYAYRATDRQDPQLDYLVYRESESGDFIFTGGVVCTLLKPPISINELQEAYDRAHEGGSQSSQRSVGN
jgi:hypothetical protein